MKTLPQISEAEFEIMKIIWKHAPISTNEITEKLTQTTKWSPKTIQTLIKRLVTKGALSYEKQSRVFVYTPLIEEKIYPYAFPLCCRNQRKHEADATKNC